VVEDAGRAGAGGARRLRDEGALEGALGVAARAAREEEDAVPLTTVSGEELGVVRFRFASDFAHRRLVRDFFEHQFTNPEGAWVIRVTGRGEVLYENARSRSSETFEVQRVMTAPSYEGCGCSCGPVTARSRRRSGAWPSRRRPSSASST